MLVRHLFGSLKLQGSQAIEPTNVSTMIEKQNHSDDDKLEAVTPRAARWIPMQETHSINAYVGIIQTHRCSSANTSFCLEFLFPLRFNIKSQMLRLAQSNLVKPAYDYFLPQLSDRISMRCRRNTAQGGSLSRTNARTNLEAHGDNVFLLLGEKTAIDTFFPSRRDGRT